MNPNLHVIADDAENQDYSNNCLSSKKKESNSVADPGCLSWIPDPKFPSRIPGKKDSGSQNPIHIKEYKYFELKKLFLSSQKYYPGCSSRIRILIFYPSRGIPGSKRHRIPDPEHWKVRLPRICHDDVAGVVYSSSAQGPVLRPLFPLSHQPHRLQYARPQRKITN
jgi:hypothetical protein